MDAFGVTANGNIEGKNILQRVRDLDVLAAMSKMSGAHAKQRLDAAREKLFAFLLNFHAHPIDDAR